MPFLQILWNPDRFTEREIVSIRDTLVDATGPALMAVDSGHVVNRAMIDARLITIGPLDLIRSDLFVTVFARDEPDRRSRAHEVVSRLADVAAGAAGHASAVVELVLTTHDSSFDYAAQE